LIRHGQVDYEGEYHSAPATVLVPPTRPDLPIMIGSTGPRMLSLTAAHMDWWNEWWSRFDNSPALLPPYIDRLDDALRAAGREPEEVVRSVALLVGLEGATGRLMGAKTDSPPITGTADEVADQLLAFSRMVDHVQIVVDPITIESIERLAPVVEKVHGG